MILHIFTILIIIKGILSQNCALTPKRMSSRWIFATKPALNKWDVLHTDYIENQKTLYFICNTKSKIGEMFCNRGRFVQKVKIPICQSRMKGTVTKIKNENSCQRKNGEFYEVRYTLRDGTIIPLYHVCYSRTDEHAVYSRHKSYGFRLAASTYTRPHFVQGGVVSTECANSYKIANVYNTFVTLLGKSQYKKYIPDNTTSVIERGHLVNAQDFPTYDQMDETFKYANVIPQFFGTNHGNWKRLENWIHSLTAPNTYAEVVTGSFDILELPHAQRPKEKVPIYLMKNNKNPVPLWLYKVVKYNRKCYAFVVLNNDFNKIKQIAPDACRPVACPSSLQFDTSTAIAVAHCCNYNAFIPKIGNHVKLC